MSRTGGKRGRPTEVVQDEWGNGVFTLVVEYIAMAWCIAQVAMSGAAPRNAN